MRVGVYTRVSTRKLKPEDAGVIAAVPAIPAIGRDFKQNPQLQVDACDSFAAGRSWTIVSRFEDRISGIKQKRPGLDALLEAARRRDFDCVLVWRGDRLARSLSHMLEVCGLLESYGVQFVSVSESMVDTTTPIGRFMFRLFAVVAEWERDLIAERVKAGMAAAKARGAVMGRHRRVFPAYKAAEELKSGASISAVARKYGIGRATLTRALGRLEAPGSLCP